MRSLDIDFAPRVAGNATKFAWWTAAFALLGFVFALWLDVWRAGLDLETRRADIAALSHRIEQASRGPAAPPAASAPPFYAADAVAVAQISGFPAQLALAAVEGVVVRGVNVVAIHLDAVRRQARLEVEFVDYLALLNYVDQLNGGDPVRRWELSNANAQSGESASPRATVLGRW